LEYLRFPSISTQSEHLKDMLACANWLKELFTTLGMKAELHETPGNPVVVAKNEHKRGRPTLLIYGHYDVQPPDPLEEWTSKPFEPTIRDGRIYARGATDNKGQTLAHILGAGELLKDGDLPVNLTFLLEGEEEIGSSNLEAFLQKHRENLACDIIVISDTMMAADYWPTIAYGLRGIASLEVIVRGPERDLHSGIFGGAVANPITAVSRLIASLHDEKGHVRIEGFYDKVRPLQDWEREATSKLPIKENDFLALAGSPILWGEEGYNTFERVGARPTAEVNGIGGGYQGEGTKTVLPKEAFAKFTFRLVPDQTPEEIQALAEAHFKKYCPPGVTIEVRHGHGGLPYFVDPTSKYSVAAKKALKDTFGQEPALMREGGSIPILQQFKTILGADALLVAFASPDCQIHSPNENMPIRNFETGIQVHKALLKELAKCQ
ncbi:MAG: dipeptidase, partial [Chthoniobacterales bacterium]